MRAQGHALVETRQAGGKTFYRRGGVWTDGAVEAEGAGSKKTASVRAMSEEYFSLLAKEPGLGRFFALGKVTVLYGGTVYKVVE